MKINRLVVLVVLLVIVIPIWLHLNSGLEKKMKIQFDVFNSSNLSGKISYLLSSHGAIRFRMNGADEIYMFVPIVKSFNGYAQFDRIAETEDSLYKPAFSDTLILTKVVTKKLYKFTFKPPS